MTSPSNAGDQAWRKLLASTEASDPTLTVALGFELRIEKAGSNPWAPRRAETANPRELAQPGAVVRLAMRPLVKSPRSKGWVQGTVTWNALRHPIASIDPIQQRWFTDLQALCRDSVLSGTAGDWLLVDHVESALFLLQLRAAEQLSIPLVTLQKHTTLSVADHAEVAIRVERVRDTVELRAEAKCGDELFHRVRAIGNNAVYAWESRGNNVQLVLAESTLDAPRRELLVAGGTLIVPAEDEAIFLDSTLPVLATETTLTAGEGIVIPAPPEPRELTGEPEITVTAIESTDPDWFELGFLVRIDGHMIPFQPLFTALSMRRKRLALADGTHFSLAHPALDRLRELIDEAATLNEWETGPRIHRQQIALWEDFEDLAHEAAPAVAWRETLEALRSTESVPTLPAPSGLRAQLRPYQQAGFEWLAFLYAHKLGGILADDMGLGKTLQILSLIQYVHAQGADRPFLVVAPTSVLTAWQSEAARFTPGLRVTLVDRAQSGAVSDAWNRSEIVITSYTVLRLAQDEFASQHWAGLVLDEAQAVKNPRAQQHLAVAGLNADVTFAVTGTPLENTLVDLWALLKLTAPGLFPSARRFREEYVQPIEQGKVPENAEGAPYRAARIDRLRRSIRPFVLRRKKEIVAQDLPPKQEQVISVELSAAHRTLYDTVLQRERQKVLGLLHDLDRQRFIVFRSLTMMRMLSLAPALIDSADAHIGSAKVDALIEHLTQLRAEGHRALVFSQFTSYLDLVEHALNEAGIESQRIDGSTRRRGEVIESFRNDNSSVFLLSLKAGGVGLTLTEADYVFLLDPWWNPAAENQAIDRAHRIGQTSQVFVYRMIAKDTIEEKVLALQQRKARLISAVIDDDEEFARSLTADDFRELFGG